MSLVFWSLSCWYLERSCCECKVCFFLTASVAGRALEGSADAPLADVADLADEGRCGFDFAVAGALAEEGLFGRPEDGRDGCLGADVVEVADHGRAASRSVLPVRRPESRADAGRVLAGPAVQASPGPIRARAEKGRFFTAR